MTCPACYKGDRAVHFCRRADCGMIAAVDLPPPNVNVTSSDAGGEYAVNVFISRRTADQTPIGRSYAGTGTSRDSAVKQVVEKIVADPYSAEWIPKKQ